MRFKQLLVFLLVVAGITQSCNFIKQEQATLDIDTVQVVMPEPTLLYNIPIDSFDVFEGKIRWGQSLSEILGDFAVTNEQIYSLANAAKGVYDVRLLKAGYKYTIIHERDSLKTARQFIFEPDKTQFVVFNLADSIYVNKIIRPSVYEEMELTATVQSSVYESVLSEGGSPLLVDKLVDVFAWQVDFFRIQKGDEFKVIYEQQRIDSTVVSVGRILGAYFKHFGHEYYAVYFDQGSNSDYFDEEGNSMRKAFLRAPLNFTRISSRYSPKRFHPVQKRYKAHLGTDYAAPVGTPIRTVGDGIVVEAQYGKYNGNYVKIRHNSNYTTQYLHMSKIATGIRAGVTVKQGQTIGFVGSTGLASGPHLCFRFWKNGKQVDALQVDLPSTGPIDPNRLKDYLHTKNVMIHRLRHIESKNIDPEITQVPPSKK